jgi:hypothetical protein
VLEREALPRRESDLPPIPGAGGSSKLFKNADDAVADLKSGSVVLSAGFGLCGTAGALLPWLPLAFSVVADVVQKRSFAQCKRGEQSRCIRSQLSRIMPVHQAMMEA